MKKASTLVVFFAVLFVLYVVIEKGTRMIENKHPKGPTALYTVVGGILITGLMVGLYYLMKMGDNQDNFEFKAPLWSQCEGGPYMYSSNPELQKKCANVNECEYTCSKGFHGRPLHFERTPMSNDKWENEMCSDLQREIKQGDAYNQF